MTAEFFRQEIREALKAYEKFIVCLEKVPDDCERSLDSLMEKAIKAYENRGPHLRHGIALDKHVTIILVEHHVEMIMAISSRVTVLDYGVVIASGSAHQVQDDPKVIEAYFGSGGGGVNEAEVMPVGTEDQGAQ